MKKDKTEEVLKSWDTVSVCGKANRGRIQRQSSAQSPVREALEHLLREGGREKGSSVYGDTWLPRRVQRPTPRIQAACSGSSLPLKSQELAPEIRIGILVGMTLPTPNSVNSREIKL